MTYEEFIQKQAPCWIEEIAAWRLQGHIVKYGPLSETTRVDWIQRLKKWQAGCLWAEFFVDRAWMKDGRLHLCWIGGGFAPQHKNCYNIPRGDSQ